MGDDNSGTEAAGSGRTCIIADDDPVVTRLVQAVLEQAGWRVIAFNDSLAALDMLDRVKPDCIIADIMMPHMDGLEFCRKVREHHGLHDLPFIILSGKSYEFDRIKAFELGASGYINKPIEVNAFADEVRDIVEDRIAVTFWGVRGTLPVPGANSLRYGGNTSCVTMNFSRSRTFIFDAGTGIKVLSDHLLKTARGKCSSSIFFSHSHWDHINALPFFAPLYISGNVFDIYGPAQGTLTVEDIVSAQMSDVYFPITVKEFAANVQYHDLHQDRYEVEGIEVVTMMLNHPGYCLGYRVNYNGRSVCYVTDNELYPAGHKHHDDGYQGQLMEFLWGADVLITDCTYFEEEYRDKAGWGHSSVNEVVQLAHGAGVGKLFLFHHDPDHSDDDIDRKLETAEQLLADMGSGVVCIAPREEQAFVI